MAREDEAEDTAGHLMVHQSVTYKTEQNDLLCSEIAWPQCLG